MRWWALSLIVTLSGIVQAQAGSAETPSATKGEGPSAPTTSIPTDSTALELIKKEQAIYPLDAEKDKLQGQVVIKVVISETGDVEQAEVESGNPALAQAALRAVKKYKFKPFIRNGKPIKVSTKLPFDFAYANNIKDIDPEDAAKATVAQGQNSRAGLSNITSGSEPQGDLRLEALNQTSALYPTEALKSKIDGLVTIRVVISQNGEVQHVEAISGNSVLSDSAMNAVKEWKFKTWKSNRYIPVMAWATINFDFKLPAENGALSASAPAAPGVIVKSGEVPMRVRVAQGVTAGLCIHKVQPVYPPAAKSARVQGTVVLQAIISKDGTIRDLKVLSGPNELQDAAAGAVQQWRYRPYVVNGEPVEVETTISVVFQLRF